MLEGKGRIYATGRSVVVRIPKDIVKDSTFPFDIGDYVQVKLENGKLIVMKISPEHKH